MTAALPAAPPSPLTVWWLAIRPKTLTISVAPVLAGTALGYADSRALAPGPMLAALAGAMLIQAATNLHNDHADYARGADTPDRLGPQRVTAMGWATPAQVARAAYLCFGGAALLGLYLVAVGGWPILLLGLLSIAAGLAYTGGPKPIAYTGLGEVFVFLFFGLGAVLGSAWLQGGVIGAKALAVAAVIGLPASAVLAVNNYRDLDGDRRAGKFTLAVRIGRTASKIEYALLLLSPFVLLALLKLWPAMAVLPVALWLIYRFAADPPGPAFNRLLANTARFQLGLAALTAMALVM